MKKLKIFFCLLTILFLQSCYLTAPIIVTEIRFTSGNINKIYIVTGKDNNGDELIFFTNRKYHLGDTLIK